MKSMRVVKSAKKVKPGNPFVVRAPGAPIPSPKEMGSAVRARFGKRS